MKFGAMFLIFLTKKRLWSYARFYNKVYKEEDNKNTEENKNTNKVTLVGYIAYLKDMYQRYGNISIAQLKHIERNIKKEGKQ